MKTYTQNNHIVNIAIVDTLPDFPIDVYTINGSESGEPIEVKGKDGQMYWCREADWKHLQKYEDIYSIEYVSRLVDPYQPGNRICSTQPQATDAYEIRVQGNLHVSK